jgi:hypothetical protein
MPPKLTGKSVKASASKSVSRDLVPVGPRHVSTKAPGHLSSKNQSKRDENGEKPTTSRAIVLRNGKYGARGTGELMLASKLTGREKLDLLAGMRTVVKTVQSDEQGWNRGSRRTVQEGYFTSV